MVIILNDDTLLKFDAFLFSHNLFNVLYAIARYNIKSLRFM